MDSVNSLLDNINSSIEDEVKSYDNSITNSLELNQLPDTIFTGLKCTNISNFYLMTEAIINKDIKEYLYCFERRPCSDRIDYTSYALYMANMVNDAEVYLTVYQSLYSVNKSKRKNIKFIDDDMSLDELTKEQRDLAIYYLIKSYRLGNNKAIFGLSYYFENGLYYFPKNISIAHKLESISLKDDEIDYWLGTDIKIE
jgi:hypothetical protein